LSSYTNIKSMCLSGWIQKVYSSMEYAATFQLVQNTVIREMCRLHPQLNFCAAGAWTIRQKFPFRQGILTFTVWTRKATRTITFIPRWWDKWQAWTTVLAWIRLAWVIKHWI